MVVASCDGALLKGMFSLATSCLEKSAPAINALNVFPVPDGDTGTNMHLTMRETMKEACSYPGSSAGGVLKAMAHGALMGAKGNSGVILAQFLRGLADRLRERESLSGLDLAAGLVEGANKAYTGISRPVEGTMLTVLREMAVAAQEEASRDGSDLVAVLERATGAGVDALKRTPFLLPVLREAGVVDAGGQGVCILMEGALSYLRGEREPREYAGLGTVDGRWLEAAGVLSGQGFGYCTEFIIRPRGRVETDCLQDKLVELGDSVLVVSDPDLVRVHVHAKDPGAVLSYALTLGSLSQVKVQNMDEQHRDFLVLRPTPQGRGLVAVAVGDGLVEVFRSLGAVVVPGGQTMNPSVRELLQAVESAPASEIVLLPNNPNIIPVATQVPALTSKKVVVVPTQSIPQGVAAAIAFNPEASLEDNTADMEAAREGVRCGEVTRATRSVCIGGIEVGEGQLIGLLEGSLVVAGEDAGQVVCQVLSRIPMTQGNLITLYYGEMTSRQQAEAVAEGVRQRYPAQGVEVVMGGQPYYEYLVSVE